MRERIEEHYICGICGCCYFQDKQAAKECCSTESRRLDSGISESEFKEKLKDVPL